MASQTSTSNFSTSLFTKHAKPMKDKNFGLSESDFNQMLQAMKQGDDALFEQIYLAHFQSCVYYLINHRGAKEEQAYSATMKSLLEIRKELIQDKLKWDNLAFYFTFKAGKKLTKIMGKGNAKMQVNSIDGMDFKDDQNFLEKLQTKEMAAFVGRALDELGEECSRILKLHYYEGLSFPKIAKIYYSNITEDMLVKKGNTLNRKVRRKCLPNFKILLEKLTKGSLGF